MVKYILLFLFSLPVFAVDNYFCDCQAGADANCVNGSDANDGLTHANAKQTLNASTTTFQGLPAGDSVLYCRGGSFTTSSDRFFINNNSTQANPVTVTDYTSDRCTTHIEKCIRSYGKVIHCFIDSGVTRCHGKTKATPASKAYVFSDQVILD